MPEPLTLRELPGRPDQAFVETEIPTVSEVGHDSWRQIVKSHVSAARQVLQFAGRDTAEDFIVCTGESVFIHASQFKEGEL